MLYKSVLVDGRSIEIMESEGKGEPLFLFHGNSFAANSFLPIISGALGRRRKLIAVSFPGHGGSSALVSEDENCSFENLGALAAKIVASFEYDHYWLLGQSLGGHAILECLSAFPGVRGVILVSSPPISAPTLSAAFNTDPSGGLLFKGALSDDEVELFMSCFLHRSDEYSKVLVKESIKNTDPKFRPALGHSLKNGDIKDELKAIMNSKCPVALLAGTEDKFLRRDFYDSLPLDRFWQKQVVWFEDCGHALNYEDPKKLERVIGEFIDVKVASQQQLAAGDAV